MPWRARSRLAAARRCSGVGHVGPPHPVVRRRRDHVELRAEKSMPVDEDLLGCGGLGRFVGSFYELAVVERRAGADEGDEVWRVHGAPAGLGGLDDLEMPSPARQLASRIDVVHGAVMTV